MTQLDLQNYTCNASTQVCTYQNFVVPQDILDAVISVNSANTSALNYTQSGEYFSVGVGLFISIFAIGKSIGLILKLVREG